MGAGDLQARAIGGVQHCRRMYVPGISGIKSSVTVDVSKREICMLMNFRRKLWLASGVVEREREDAGDLQARAIGGIQHCRESVLSSIHNS